MTADRIAIADSVFSAKIAPFQLRIIFFIYWRRFCYLQFFYTRKKRAIQTVWWSVELEYRSKSYMLFRTRANLWDLALDDYEGSLLNINIKTQYIYIYIYQITLQLFKRRLNVNTIPSFERWVVDIFRKNCKFCANIQTTN